MDNQRLIEKWFTSRKAVYEQSKRIHKQISSAASLIVRSLLYSPNGKLLIFGNGGSAAQAQHFAAELVCQYEKSRIALPAMALTTDTSILTAQSNDSGFPGVFSRQIEALCNPGDTVVGLTTSDFEDVNNHSTNIRDAFLTAREAGANNVGLFSLKTQKLLPLVDVAVIAPSRNTAIIQEIHLSVIHLLCSIIEDALDGEEAQ